VPDAPRRRRPAPRAKPATRAPAAPKRKPAPKPKTVKEPKAPDPARRRAVVRGALLSVLLVGVLFAFVYPTQTFLDQRDATSKAREQLDLLRAENAKLADATARLQDDDEIARIAREFYGLVKPGEHPFVILPAPTTTTARPAPPASAPSGTAKPAP
jgi:cell division protein FtsB